MKTEPATEPATATPTDDVSGVASAAPCSPHRLTISGMAKLGGFDYYAILQDGFNGRNEYVQMELRPLDGGSEGEGLAIEFSTDILNMRGDYLPITLNKEELKSLIDYLTTAYSAICEANTKASDR